MNYSHPATGSAPYSPPWLLGVDPALRAGEVTIVLNGNRQGMPHHDNTSEDLAWDSFIETSAAIIMQGDSHGGHGVTPIWWMGHLDDMIWDDFAATLA